MDKKKDKPEFNDLAEMMALGLKTQIVITKKVGEDAVEVSGGTGLMLFDMYVVIRALEYYAKEVKPMLKPGTMKPVLHNLVELFDLGDDEESKDRKSEVESDA